MKWDADRYVQACSAITNRGRELISILQIKNCRKILDVGCGTGALTGDIAEFADEVIGIDVSEEMIKKAKQTYPHLNLMVMDARRLEWEEYFDAVFSNAVFHFIKDQASLLDSTFKVLKNEGYLVCEFGAKGNIADILFEIERVLGNREKTFENRFYYPSSDEYAALLVKNGFILEEIAEYDIRTPLAGQNGLRDWINVVFSLEMEWFDALEREIVLEELENSLRKTHYDNGSWFILNRRLRVIAQKKM